MSHLKSLIFGTHKHKWGANPPSQEVWTWIDPLLLLLLLCLCKIAFRPEKNSIFILKIALCAEDSSMHRAYTVLLIVSVPSSVRCLSVSTFMYEMLSVIVCGCDPLPSIKHKIISVWEWFPNRFPPRNPFGPKTCSSSLVRTEIALYFYSWLGYSFF